MVSADDSTSKWGLQERGQRQRSVTGRNCPTREEWTLMRSKRLEMDEPEDSGRKLLPDVPALYTEIVELVLAELGK